MRDFGGTVGGTGGTLAERCGGTLAERCFDLSFWVAERLAVLAERWRYPPCAPPKGGGCAPARTHARGDHLMPPHHTPALSPSRLWLYTECPALYKRRYVDKIFDPPTIDMEYGQAIHAGLEAHFLGGDAELTFLRTLKTRLEPLIQKGADPAEWLIPQGLKLLDQVARLGWTGVPEQAVWLVLTRLNIPIRGFVDLMRQDTDTVVDWKTTQHPWSEKTAARYDFQRVIYTQAAFETHERVVEFQFGVLGAYPGGYLQVIDATPTAREMMDTFDKIRSIAALIDAEQWGCTCKSKQHVERAA